MFDLKDKNGKMRFSFVWSWFLVFFACFILGVMCNGYFY